MAAPRLPKWNEHSLRQLQERRPDCQPVYRGPDQDVDASDIQEGLLSLNRQIVHPDDGPHYVTADLLTHLRQRR